MRDTGEKWSRQLEGAFRTAAGATVPVLRSAMTKKIQSFAPFLAALMLTFGCAESRSTEDGGAAEDARVGESDGATADSGALDSGAMDAGPLPCGSDCVACARDLDCVDEEMCVPDGYCVPNSCPGTGGESMGCGERPECGDAIGILIAQCWQCVDPVTCERVD